MKKIKRIFLIFISVFIFGITIYTDYQSVKAFDIPTAFWGTLEASRAFWTALQAGGGVRGGGVSMASFEHSSREDMHDLQVQVMLAYTAFCIMKEKAALKLAHPDWSNDEIDQQAEVNGRLASDRFQNSAINVNDTTNNLTIKDFGYWREFCKSINSIAKNGLGGGSIGDNTNFISQRTNFSDVTITSDSLSNVGSNTFTYNENTYVYAGKALDIDFSFETSATDRVLIPYLYCCVENGTIRCKFFVLHINRLTGQIITIVNNSDWVLSFTNSIEEKNRTYNAVNHISNFPIVFDNDFSEENYNTINNNYDDYLSVNDNNVKEFEQYIKNALDNTQAGNAIKDGVAEGQEEIIENGYIPVKRSSVRAGEETATGTVGWDVPDSRTLEGAIAVPDTQDDVVEGMGVISVPEDVVRPKDDDTVAEWAKDEPVSIPDTRDEPISQPIDDVISDQYGDYYPTQISLSDFFPFCIPFDIYYCVQKFNVGQGEAPIIHIPIVYPRALQGALGESYDVIIDFNNYIALRNIIRVFILIFFLVGLMQLTRNLIRG